LHCSYGFRPRGTSTRASRPVTMESGTAWVINSRVRLSAFGFRSGRFSRMLRKHSSRIRSDHRARRSLPGPVPAFAAPPVLSVGARWEPEAGDRSVGQFSAQPPNPPADRSSSVSSTWQLASRLPSTLEFTFASASAASSSAARSERARRRPPHATHLCHVRDEAISSGAPEAG